MPWGRRCIGSRRAAWVVTLPRGPCVLLLEESSDGDSEASEDDTGSELGAGSDTGDEEGDLADGSGENTDARAAALRVPSL